MPTFVAVLTKAAGAAVTKMLIALAKAAGAAAIKMLMSLATEDFFREVFLMLADMAAKSTKTDFDNSLLEKMKVALDKE